MAMMLSFSLEGDCSLSASLKYGLDGWLLLSLYVNKSPKIGAMKFTGTSVGANYQ